MKKILVCEDEDAIRDFVVINLTRAGYEVTEATNGEEALQKYDEFNGDFDVAILDIMMPKIDGITVLKEIRKKGNLIPVLLLIAKSEVDDKVEGLDAGANDYLAKPFHSKELLARIRAMTRVQTGQTSSIL